MTKRTVEVFECDLCGEPGDRYTVAYPDGTLALDRCPEHAVPIMSLRDDAGGHWTPNGAPGKSTFRVSSVGEILAQKIPS